MQKLLFISISSPHKSGPESIQTGRYLKGLSDYFEISFVTTKPTNYGWVKKEVNGVRSLEKYATNIIELNGYDNRLYSKLKSYLPEKIKFPDNYFHFHRNYKNILQKRNPLPDVLYSRSGPLSSAILACKMSILYDTPWVMHLSDPWTDSPFYKSNIKLHKKWEKKCFETAKAITVTTENYKNLLILKYPQFKNKIFTSYNVYCDLEKPPKIEIDKFRLVYTGNFYGDRTPSSLLEAMALGYSSNTQLYKDIDLLFYGNLSSKTKNLISSYNLPFVKVKGNVEQKEIKNIINKAMIVVNIEEAFKDPYDTLFLPSKVIDYMAMQKVILSISSRKSPSFNLIQNNYGKTFSFEEKKEVTTFITEAIKAYNKRDYSFFSVKPPLIEYALEYQSKKTAAILIDVVNQ